MPIYRIAVVTYSTARREYHAVPRQMLKLSGKGWEPEGRARLSCDKDWVGAGCVQVMKDSETLSTE